MKNQQLAFLVISDNGGKAYCHGIGNKGCGYGGSSVGLYIGDTLMLGNVEIIITIIITILSCWWRRWWWQLSCGQQIARRSCWVIILTKTIITIMIIVP
jgi:hypothetical protein